MDGPGTAFTGYNTCTRGPRRARRIVTGGGRGRVKREAASSLCLSSSREFSAGTNARRSSGSDSSTRDPTVISIAGFVSANAARRVERGSRAGSDCTLRYSEASCNSFRDGLTETETRGSSVCARDAHTHAAARDPFYPRPVTSIGIRVAMTYIRALRWELLISRRDKSAAQGAPYIRWECPFFQVDPQRRSATARRFLVRLPRSHVTRARLEQNVIIKRVIIGICINDFPGSIRFPYFALQRH